MHMGLLNLSVCLLSVFFVSSMFYKVGQKSQHAFWISSPDSVDDNRIGNVAAKVPPKVLYQRNIEQMLLTRSTY